MARNGSGVFSKPAGTTAVAGTTIESSKYNQTIDDLVNDANLARPVVAGGTGASNAAGARSALGVEIGVNVQAYSPNLTSMSAVGAVADRIMYTTGPITWAGTVLTAFARTLLDDATAAEARATLGASQIPLDEDDFASNSATRPPSQQSARQFIINYVASFVPGASQTWQDLSGSRTGGVAYQNNTSQTIWVSIYEASTSTRLIQVSANGSTWVTIGTTGVAGNASAGAIFPVRPGEYYRVATGGSLDIWSERR